MFIDDNFQIKLLRFYTVTDRNCGFELHAKFRTNMLKNLWEKSIEDWAIWVAKKASQRYSAFITLLITMTILRQGDKVKHCVIKKSMFLL